MNQKMLLGWVALTLMTTPAMATDSGMRMTLAHCTSAEAQEGLRFDVEIKQNTETGTLLASGTSMNEAGSLHSRIDLNSIVAQDEFAGEKRISRSYWSSLGRFSLQINLLNISSDAAAYSTLNFEGEEYKVRCDLR